MQRLQSGRHFLQIPGPTNVPDRILRAIERPTIDHRGPEFEGLGLEVFESTGRGDLGHIDAVAAIAEPGWGSGRLHGPADEGGEATGFILQRADPFEVFDSFGERFDVSEHHGRR